MNIGRKVLELRKQKNITQEELAAELGVTAAAVSKWENSYTMPDILMLCALADYFEVTADDLLGRSNETKYAIITAQEPNLLKEIEAITQLHGLTVAYKCTSYEDALSMAHQDNRIHNILVSCNQPLTKQQWDDTPDHLRVIDCPNISNNQVLAGFEEFFRTHDM